MKTSASSAATRYHCHYLTEEVATRARMDELLQELIQALVYTVVDYDMYVTGKFVPSDDDHEDTYWYFRGIFDRLGTPLQAVVDVIDE